ncbi:hypothetical protein J3E68DRAFT_418606 [Trichoderma sp. SZMC 28012]
MKCLPFYLVSLTASISLSSSVPCSRAQWDMSSPYLFEMLYDQLDTSSPGFNNCTLVSKSVHGTTVMYRTLWSRTKT